MSLFDLPAEILLSIAERLDKAKDIFALSYLTRAKNDHFLHQLYKFNVRRQRSSALIWGVCKGDSKFVKKMLRNY